jgi:hypothetical protein
VGEADMHVFFAYGDAWTGKKNAMVHYWPNAPVISDYSVNCEPLEYGMPPLCLLYVVVIDKRRLRKTFTKRRETGHSLLV